MTPLKAIVWWGTLVCAMDESNQLTVVACASSEKQAAWVAWSLGKAHHVPHQKGEGGPPLARVSE
jgi:hypothetical protein